MQAEQEIEWTEARAIAALEENEQVMIPGLREQANGQKIYVEHEFAKLRGVIVGNPNSTYLPDPFHPSWYTSFRSAINSTGLPKTAVRTFARSIRKTGKRWPKSSMPWPMRFDRPVRM